MKSGSPTSFFSEQASLRIVKVRLELHGIFWFHTFAQPRDKYTHTMIPLIHNYPLTLAFMGLPGEAYVSVSGIIPFAFKSEKVWEKHGFYVYPAVAEKILSRILTFSMGGTGYVQLKPRTRASVPDYTANQVLLPGTTFRTYIIVRENYKLPSFIRLGSKRYGVFRVKDERRYMGRVENGSNKVVSHPFNARDVGAPSYHAVLRHYAGALAISGVVDRVIVAEDAVLALPKFIGGNV